MQPPFRCNGIDLVGRNPIRKHGIEVESRANRFSGVCPVACNHHNAFNAGIPQGLNRMGCFLSQLVG